MPYQIFYAGRTTVCCSGWSLQTYDKSSLSPSFLRWMRATDHVAASNLKNKEINTFRDKTNNYKPITQFNFFLQFTFIYQPEILKWFPTTVMSAMRLLHSYIPFFQEKHVFSIFFSNYVIIYNVWTDLSTNSYWSIWFGFCLHIGIVKSAGSNLTIGTI